MDLKLIQKLKKETHKRVAYAQDLIIEELFNLIPNTILHGGTAIWRCYKGSRFSEDIDVYLKKDMLKIEQLFLNLENKGFKIKKLRIKDNSLYSLLEFNRVEIRLEGTFQNKKGVLRNYETLSGNTILIYSLDESTLIQEKVETYLKRKLIRDLYDIFFLLNQVHDNSVKNSLKKLINNYTNPLDEPTLRITILSGVTPKSKDMLGFIQKWVK